MKKWFKKKHKQQQETDTQPQNQETDLIEEELEETLEFNDLEEVEDSELLTETDFAFSNEEQDLAALEEAPARKKRWFRWGGAHEKPEKDEVPASYDQEPEEEPADLTEVEAGSFEAPEEYPKSEESLLESSVDDYSETEAEREHKRFGWFKKSKREEESPEEPLDQPVLQEVREADEDTVETRYEDEGVGLEEPAIRKKPGFFARLKQGLAKTRKNFLSGLDVLVAGRKVIDEDLLEELEELLITSDIGVKTTLELIKRIQKKVDRNELEDPSALKSYLEREISELMNIDVAPLDWSHKPLVIMVIGVNGAGKTTTIGKLASHFQEKGKKVLLVAADTFRAAAIEQLEVWSERVGCQLIKHKSGSDPSAVAFDGVKAAQARNADVVIIDTAGRLHTKINLMEELKKMRRVIGGQIEDAPHEALLVLDSTTGQNALSQAKMFNDTIGVTGLVLTKLDGTAKGGIVLAITQELNIPVRYIGVGEALDDLREFNPRDFAAAMFEN